MIGALDPKVPSGPLDRKWQSHRDHSRLVSPNNRRKFEIIIVGSGLAGGSAAATLGELGYKVKCFLLSGQPAARAQHRRARRNQRREKLSERRRQRLSPFLRHDQGRRFSFARSERLSAGRSQRKLIIDQCVAQGVPFAREYGGLLANRSFGGAQVSRTFYARGQTGQQIVARLLIRRSAARSPPARCKCFRKPKCSISSLVDGHAKGIITRRSASPAKSTTYAGDAVVLATGGYGNVFYLSTNARGCNVTATYRAYKKGALFANPCFTQIHPTCIPRSGDYQSKLT